MHAPNRPCRASGAGWRTMLAKVPSNLVQAQTTHLRGKSAQKLPDHAYRVDPSANVLRGRGNPHTGDGSAVVMWLPVPSSNHRSLHTSTLSSSELLN
jgi:hypothetical protein